MIDTNRISDFYSKTVLEHMTAPRNWGVTQDCDGFGRAAGSCGDTMEIALKIKDDSILACTFESEGCGATIACGSIVTQMATGRRVAEARRIDQKAILEYCGGLPDKNGHCALLAAEALQRAIDDHYQMQRAPWKKLYRTAR
ncbi:MAG: iron-sulfur cluster assembly scaffold protein [candidate division WOR-3 bacterium]|nr:MAG: iron-sulfur cluster assembly scaffold protein [candidate division WOR-3 bacterium]